jgi:DNA-binding MarR family transcriptional regulator
MTSVDETAQAADAPWLDAIEARAWRGYLLMSRLLFAELGRGLSRDANMSHADYEVLVVLSETPGHRLRMNELASRLVWEKSRLSHQITRMQQRGLVGRQECASDARGSFVVLTDAGLAAITSAAPNHVRDVRRNFFDLLTPEQVESLAAMTETVVDHLRGTCDAAEPGDEPSCE